MEAGGGALGGGALAVRLGPREAGEDEGESGDDGERVEADPFRPEGAGAVVLEPGKGGGPEEPADGGAEECGGIEPWAAIGEAVDERGNDEGVGHREPDGPEELEVHIRDEHVGGVHEPEEDEPDGGDILGGGVEDDGGEGDGEGHEEGGVAEEDGTEDREDERPGDDTDGAVEGELA